MKIDGFGKSSSSSKTSKSDKSSKAKKAGGKGRVAAKSPSSSNDKLEAADRMEVSGSVETLDQIRQMVAETPDIRVGEIDRIVSELKSGQYKVDFNKVAEGFIKETLLNEVAKRKSQSKVGA